MAGSNYIETPVASHYAFIDLGSGNGGSIDHCVRRFGRGPGRGFELDPAKVAEARRAGYDVVEADVRLVHVPDRSVEFVSAMDFLDHLPDVATAASVLEKFARVVVELTLAMAQVSSFRVMLTNDGACDAGDGITRDTNVYVRAISLEGPIAAGSKSQRRTGQSSSP